MAEENIDQAILRHALVQQGLVGRAQVVGEGFDRWLLDDRVRRRTLIPVLPGIYAVGHPRMDPEARLVAGLLFAGEGSLLCRQTAAARWGLMRWNGAVHVLRDFNRVMPGRRRDSWLTVHRTRFLPRSDMAVQGGLAVTSVERTLLDLAGTLSRPKLESCVVAAERLRVLDSRKMQAIVTRGRGWKGIDALRSVIDGFTTEITRTRSELEELFFSLCLEAGFPVPEVNYILDGFEVDCYWPRYRLVVEMDSREFHLNTKAFETDKKRDELLQKAGYKVLRITYRRLQDDAAGVVETMLALTSR